MAPFTYNIPDFDFGSFAVGALEDPSSSLRRTFAEEQEAERVEQQEALIANDAPNASSQEASGNASSHASGSTAFRSRMQSGQLNSPPRFVEQHFIGVQATGILEIEEEALERTLELSHKTAEEDALRRKFMQEQQRYACQPIVDQENFSFVPLSKQPPGYLQPQQPPVSVPSSSSATPHVSITPVPEPVPPMARHESSISAFTTMRAPFSQSPPSIELPRASSSRTQDAKLRIATKLPGSGEICGDCDTVRPVTCFCNVCCMVLCAECWDRQAVHRKKSRPGDLPHEKTNHNIAKKIKEVLAPNLTEAAREQLHADDSDTTWFGIVRDGSELPLFADYGRYANLIARTRELASDSTASPSSSQSTTDMLYPSLVSFVGETGAGKSTLIKLLIDLNIDPSDPDFPTPVVGAHGRDVPTSEDVHLYLDPESSMSRSQTPLLFADCEGLGGGGRDPMGARTRKQMKERAEADRSAAGIRRKHRMKPVSERQLLWADTDKKQMREYAVANLYPRLLYTFSDVVVFVLKNPRYMKHTQVAVPADQYARTIEGVVERLVDWAQKALEESSNQPVLPHVIIALNAAENDIPEQLWDVDKATQALMNNLAGAVESNQVLKRHAKFWKDRDRQVSSVEQLVLSYYSSVRVVRIPADGIPNRIQGQVKKLAAEISSSCEAARLRKTELRMLLNADETEPYLQVAFDHFAKNLDEPFDFVQAAFTNSPIPNDFGGNILKLAIQVMNNWTERHVRASFIFEELSYVIASCIMLNLARNRYLGQPEETYPEYLDHIDNALDNFCGRHWPCEFTNPKGDRCVNVRSGHGAKGHQLKSGKLLAAGDYQSSFSFAGYREKFRYDVYAKLTAIHAKVRERMQDERSEDRAAAEIHKESVLLPFFEHAFRGDQRAFVSHSVCYVCLFESSEHALPCGHTICGPCLRAYGKLGRSSLVEIYECPMEPRQNRWRLPWKVHLKPPAAGVRILTLDGYVRVCLDSQLALM